MSKEYDKPAKVGTCSVFARKVLALAKPHGLHSLGLLHALLTVEDSVVFEAFEALGFPPKELLLSLQEHRDSLAPENFAQEPPLSKLAEQKARTEGFPLGTDHLLEVIWDEETLGYEWLRQRFSAEALEQALNSVRYPEEPSSGARRTDKPIRPSPTSSAQRLVG